MQISIIMLSEVMKNPDFRLDSEFHKKPFKKNEKYEYRKIRDILTYVQYGISIAMNEEGKGYKIYRMNEISNMFCDRNVSKYAEIFDDDIKKFELKENDILFNRTNSYEFVGRTGIFKKFSDEQFVFYAVLLSYPQQSYYH